MPEEEPNRKDAKGERFVVIYSYSPVFYWWPLWLVGVILAAVTYIGGERAVWLEDPAAAVPARIDHDPGEVNEAPRQVRISQHKALGFVFAVVLCFVFFHSNVVWRGYRAYFFLAAGVSAFLAVMLIHTLFPQLELWRWVKRIVFYAPDIHISADGYLFISSFLFVVWLFVIFVYNRWRYMRFESGQVRIVEEVGEGENVYDTTNMTFEKQKVDLFRHYLLGLGFLRPLRHILPRSIARYLEAMTGTGDLIVRIGGDADKVIMWPNVLNIDTKLEEITTLIKSRRVVSA